MHILLLSLFSFFIAAQSSDDINIPMNYQELHGKTFEVQGPNCFATALKVTGRVPSYRYVDGKEFDLFAKLACTQETVPQIGDIGVYKFADGFALIHAYVYLNPTYGLEKEGGDQVGGGKTPVRIRTLGAIQSVHGGDSLCMQYAEDDSVCMYPLTYERCRNLDFSHSPWAQQFLLEMEENETLMGEFIESKTVGPAEVALNKRIVKAYETTLLRFESEVALAVAPELVKKYLRERLRSHEIQLKAFEIRLRSGSK